MAIRLSVNVNKIALLRNTRDLNLPDVMDFVALAVDAGAQGITVHPRPDGRHIRPHDVEAIALYLKGHPDIEFNIEGNPFHPPMLDLVRLTRPAQATLVPDEPLAPTSNQGWTLTAAEIDRLQPIIAGLRQQGVRVSLFLDARPERVELVQATGADRIELYTEPFARAHGGPQGQSVFQTFVATAERAVACGLGVNAGHDLNLSNLKTIRQLPGLQEVSIGHALTADALLMGWQSAIRAYLQELQ